MKRQILLILTLIPLFLNAQTSIYDIQYTTESVDGTYPSTYANQTVTTGGIVTVANYNGGRYFIGSSNGGPWTGLFIYDNTNSPAVGDSILITGLVFEYNGMTEMKDLTSFEVISTNNPLPPFAHINTNQVEEEAYEGLLVQVSDCAVTETYDSYSNWSVDDGSGSCTIRSGIYNLENELPLFMDYPFANVKGIVTDYYGQCILPRSSSDIQAAENAYILYTNDTYVTDESSIALPIHIKLLNQNANITSYEINMSFDETIFTYNGFVIENTISESGSIEDNSSGGQIDLTFTGDANFSNNGVLIKLNFTPFADGEAFLEFTNVDINGNNITYFTTGELLSGSSGCDTPQADTVTTIQRPLLNIPAIVSSGETLHIECFAPETTTNWDASLYFENIAVDLTITQSDYNTNLNKWTLQALMPNVDYFELYDLHVTASGGISDTARNAVKIINTYKDEYYFIQITDTHLPGHTFWGDEGYDIDDSELSDFEQVIDDINLINPEFVLLTGDLINEGEMEDFECLRHHTKTVELLEKFEVPVFIVPGNHDLGGWESTPPSQGTSRREWWRFFGWRQQTIPPVHEEYYVHDYTFDYDEVHFIGMEASDNYDSYLYEIYGKKGFIPSQLTWLENEVTSNQDKTNVLFYHYDFNDDINLETLGADMALWGHTHSNTDDYTHPFDIGTDNVCDETMAYRMIRVNNAELSPENTIYVNGIGENLIIEYNEENNGLFDSLSATITNNHDKTFQHGVVKFIMPVSEYGYSVTNGTMRQVIPNGNHNICYVNVSIQQSSTITTSIVKNAPNSIAALDVIGKIGQNYPNPFQHSTQIDFSLTKSAYVELIIYNTVGQKIKSLMQQNFEQGQHSIQWDGTNDSGSEAPNGIYFYKFTVNNKQVASKQVVKE
jgi:predicted phosphodiesterase